MSVGSAQYAVSTSAVLIASAPAGPSAGPVGAVWVLPDVTNDIYLGGSNVTTSNGLKVLHSTTPFGPVTLFAGDNLYAIAGSSSTVSVLQT